MVLNTNKKSLLYALSAVVLWSTVASAFKISLRGMTVEQLLFFASATSTLLLFVIVIIKHQNELRAQFTSGTIKHNALTGFLNPFLYYLILFKAYSLLPAQEAQAVNFTWPIAIAILSSLVFKQRLSLQTIIGIIAAFVGVYIIISKGSISNVQFTSLIGDLLAFGSAFIWGAFWIINLKDRRSSAIKLFGGFLFGTIYTALYIIFFGSFEILNKSYLWGAVYVGCFEMGITFFLWLKALELSGNKAKTATLAYLSPFLSFIIIALVLKERILLSSIVGLILIIGGILFQNLNIKYFRSK